MAGRSIYRPGKRGCAISTGRSIVASRGSLLWQRKAAGKHRDQPPEIAPEKKEALGKNRAEQISAAAVEAPHRAGTANAENPRARANGAVKMWEGPLCPDSSRHQPSRGTRNVADAGGEAGLSKAPPTLGPFTPPDERCRSPLACRPPA